MTDVKKEKSQRVNFTKDELNLVKSLVLKHPIIEKKMHDQNTEQLRKSSWQVVEKEFNAEGLNVSRNVNQLKGAWKRVKNKSKTKRAPERRSKFRAGGGPPSPAAVMDDLLVDQNPLDNIPDCDDDYNDDDPDIDILGSTASTTNVDVKLPTAGPATTPTSRAATPQAVPTDLTETTTEKVTSFAEEFHNKRMEYMKLEHELKMKVLEEERSYWALMKNNAQKFIHPVNYVQTGNSSKSKTSESLRKLK